MKQLFTAQILAIAVCLFTANHTKAQSVGINTTSPHGSAVLDVSSTTKGILVPRMTTAQRTAIDTPAIGLLVFDTDLQQFIFNADTGWVKIPVGAPATGSGAWTVNGNNQYSALSGNVGIGIDSATNKLHVVGGSRIDGRLGIFTAQPGSLGNDLAYPAIESVSDNSNQSDLNMVLIESNNYSPWLNFGKARGTTQQPLKAEPDDNLLTILGHGYDSTGFKVAGGIELRVSGNTGEDNIPTSLLFSTSDSGTASLTNRMVINHKGHVGIGNMNPTEKLDVAGKTKTGQLQITDGAINGYVLQTDASGNAAWVNANTLAVSYNETDPKIAAVNNNAVQRWNGTKLVDGVIRDDSTNVGIGTNPMVGNRLTVNGKLATTNFQIPTGAANGYVLQSDAVGNAAWVSSTALPNANWTIAGSNQFSAVIGNVGIGTNSPSAKLDVAGTAKVTNFQMPTGATTGYVMRSDAVGNASWVNTNTLTVNETDPQVASTTGGRVPKWSGTSLVDGIMQDDGLGIGINTAPTTATALTVNGKTSTSSLQITTGAASGYILRSNGTTGNAVWADPATVGFPETDPQVAAATANTVPRWNGTALVDGQLVDNGTNIGIGTATPGSKLDVVGTIRTTGLQLTTGATNGYLLQGNAAGVATWVNPASLAITETDPKVGTLTNNLIPRWNGTSLANTQVFDNGTATGIATTAPLSVLDVNGAMGLKVRGALTSSSTNPDNTAGIWIYTTNSGPITLPAANTCANRMYVIANRAITPILMNPATSYIGLNGILATNIAASSAIWIVSDGSVWQQIR